MCKVRVCFEVADVTCNESGQLIPMCFGVQICLGESVKEWPYEDLITHIDISKVAAMVHRDPKDLTIITPQEYDERYGDRE